MLMQAEITGMGTESYQGKRGQVNTHVLTLLDRTKNGPRLKNTVDFMLTDEQAKLFPNHGSDAATGKSIEVGIDEISAGFGGRMRVRGTIIKCEVFAKP